MVEELIKILEKVCVKITSGYDVTWTYSEDATEFRMEIEKHIKELGSGNLSPLEYLNYLFFASGPIQEHSMANNWTNQYNMISTEFDRVYKELKANPKN